MSQDINSVVVIGRLTRDAELKYLPSGTTVSTFTLANNYRQKSGDQWTDNANFLDCSYFGKGAEGLLQYLLKGKQVAVNGELRQERWEKDGNKFSRIKIIASHVELLGSNEPRQAGNTYSEPKTSQPQRQSEVFEDDIPF